MALVVLLRGVNVGGHRTFRPTVLARQLKHLDPVNIGAAGTFVIRRPVTRAQLRAELARRLPFATEVVICEGRDVVRLMSRDPFAGQPTRPDLVPFVSFLSRRPRVLPPTPVVFPPNGQWLVKILATDSQFVLGMYRRDMKTIGYLGAFDKLLSVPVTTRNWNTIIAIARVLGHPESRPQAQPRETDMKKSGSDSGKTPSQLIDARIKELGDWRGKMLGRLRALIKAADPKVVEEWKWGGPVWSHDGIICTGESYKKAVKLTFAHGAALKDPSGLFNSSLEGNTRRAIDFSEGEKIDEKAFKTLIRAAVTLNKS